MSQQHITSLYVGWYGPTRHTWYPIGELRAVADGYTFHYVQGALDAQNKEGFRGIIQFPDFHKQYESEDLFSFVENRLMPSSRPDYPTRMRRLGFDPLAGDLRPFDILSRTNGQRITDTFELFAPPVVQNQKIQMYFFTRGFRYLAEKDRTHWEAGHDPRTLKITWEADNPHDSHALQIRDAANILLGYVPRYYSQELKALIDADYQPHLTLAVHNKASNFIRERFLIRYESAVPQDWGFPQSAAYAPLIQNHSSAA